MSEMLPRDEDKNGSIRIEVGVFPGGECTFGARTSISACTGTGEERDQSCAGRR